MSRFSGKIAVVTGGAHGIGRAIAGRLARDGAVTVIIDRDADVLENTAVEVAKDTGGTVRHFLADLASGDDIDRVFGDIRSKLGPVDILVNNVGQTARENITEFWCSEPATWDFVIGISMMSTLRASRNVVPHMREAKQGKIVCIASDSALIGDTGIADYAAAKAGVMGFVRSLARELAPFDVNVNAVCPGLTNTRGPLKMPKSVYDASLSAIPMGRACDPSDIANAVAFLASEESRFVTGQALLVNGGRIFH